jgi:hypothetical protein
MQQAGTPVSAPAALVIDRIAGTGIMPKPTQE